MAAIFPKNIPASKMKTGNRALHGIKGATAIVSNLSSSDSIPRVAITAGTLHPSPRIKGITDFPCKPTFLIILSKMNAALAK